MGLNTVTDFLRKKGVAIDGSPNTQISGDIYAMVEKEFGANRTSGSARDNIREKISTKQATVSIEEPKAEPKRTIEVKDEVQQPKILGRVELDKNGNIVKPQPKAEPKPEPKPQPKVEPKVEPAPQPAPQPKAEPVAVEPKENGAFRATATPTLSGPQILGKIDVSGMVPGGKHKRKRLEKEKVNVAKEGKSVGKPEKGQQKGGNNNNNQRPHNGQAQQGGQPQQPNNNKKNKKKSK
mgnify:CR=1 FL=1